MGRCLRVPTPAQRLLPSLISADHHKGASRPGQLPPAVPRGPLQDRAPGTLAARPGRATRSASAAAALGEPPPPWGQRPDTSGRPQHDLYSPTERGGSWCQRPGP